MILEKFKVYTYLNYKKRTLKQASGYVYHEAGKIQRGQTLCSAANIPIATATVVATATATVVATKVPATAAAEQQDKDNDPPTTAATKTTIVTTHIQDPPIQDNDRLLRS